jgi:flagellar hook-associated protein 3 FlgL
MRISTDYNFSLLLGNISQAQENYVNLQNTLSTGKSINQVSDNPYVATLSITQTTIQSSLTQFNQNLGYANSFLGFTDSALSSTEDLVNSAYSLASQAANSTVDQNARNAMVSQISQLQQQLVSIGNSTGPSGEYIFAGQVTQTQPFTVSGNTLTYNGDGNAINVPTGPNSTLQINTPGSPLFTNLYNQLETMKSDLQSGNVTALSSVDMANLDQTRNSILQTRGTVGAAIQSVSSLTSANSRRSDELTTLLSNETDADYASTVVKYTEAQTVYQSALSVAGQAFKLNLTSFLP